MPAARIGRPVRAYRFSFRLTTDSPEDPPGHVSGDDRHHHVPQHAERNKGGRVPMATTTNARRLGVIRRLSEFRRTGSMLDIATTSQWKPKGAPC